MKIERFPLYEFTEGGHVISNVRKNSITMKPIKMSTYKGLQLLKADGSYEKIYLHRAICEANLGACPVGMECRHIDGDKTNNKSSNLIWGTRLESAFDKIDHGTPGVGEDNNMAVITDEIVMEMRKYRGDTGESYKKIGFKFNISTMTAYRAIVGTSWSHLQ